MRRNGYRAVTKELVQFADDSKKSDLDVEIAVDMDDFSGLLRYSRLSQP